MKILAFEFSTEHRSVACGEDGRALGRAEIVAGRATPAFALIADALKIANWEREDIDGIAVGLGPGSYTGIRAAVAIAQGWQAACGVKLIGIPSVEVLAAEAQSQGILGKVSIVIDAQRNEFYFAQFQITTTECTLVRSLKLATPTEIKNCSHDLIVGPEANRWFESAKPLAPTAGTLIRLAKEATNYVTGEKLEPIYLRETTFVKAPPLRQLPT